MTDDASNQFPVLTPEFLEFMYMESAWNDDDNQPIQPDEVESDTDYDCHPLCAMAKNGDYTGIQKFLAQDSQLVNIDHAIDEKNDRSALLQAVLVREERIVELLLSPPPLPDGRQRIPPNPNRTDKLNFFPLWGAAQDGQMNIVRLLLQHGANVNQRMDDAEMGHTTSLWQATVENHVEVVRLLLKHGADPNLCEQSQNVMPIEMADLLGHSEISKLLFDHNAMSVATCMASPAGNFNFVKGKISNPSMG